MEMKRGEGVLMDNTNLKRDKIMGIIAGVIIITMVIVAVVLLKGGGSHRLIKIYELDGEAIVTREDSGDIDAYEDMVLESGDLVYLKTGTMTLRLDEDKYIYVEAGTEFELIASGSKNKSKTRINLNEGTITNEIGKTLKKDASYEVNTPNANLSVRGTVFTVAVYDINGVLYTRNTVTEGEVVAKLVNVDGVTSEEEVVIPAGKEVIIYENNGETDYLTEVEDISDDTPTLGGNGNGGSGNNLSGDANATSSELTTDTVKHLMEENLYVVFNIFWYKQLQVSDTPYEGSLYPVIDPQFPDYASLENYLNTIYCSAYVIELLNEPLYVNIDGGLYLDMNYASGGGYYVDWTNATYEITSVSDTQATFTATGTAQWPGEETTEPYTAAGTLVLENGRWVLTGFVE